jgi:phage I-like protein
MPAIFPSTALKTNQKELKNYADKEVVYITENGYGKYAFMSEEVLQRLINDAVENALYEARVAHALRESTEDFAAGRVYEGIDAMMAEVERRRALDA